MKKLVTATVIAGLTLISAAEVFARGPGTSDSDFNGRRRLDARDRSPGAQYEVVSDFIGQTFYPGQKIFLRKELGLNAQHRGKEIERVQLEIEGMQRGGVMTLTINGQQVSRPQQFFGGRVGDQVVSFDLQRPFVLGQNTNQVQIEVDGTAYVREALVILKSSRVQPDLNRPLVKEMHKDIIGTGTLELADYMDANQRQENKVVKYVALEFYSYARHNQLRLCSNEFVGHAPGRFARPAPTRCDTTKMVEGAGDQQIRIFPQSRQELKDLIVAIRGDITLKKVTVAFE